MNVELSVPEVVGIFKEIQEQPKQVFEMIRGKIKERQGQYLSNLMATELAYFFERERHERSQREVNHRNGSYNRSFLLREIQRGRVEAPLDPKGESKTGIRPEKASEDWTSRKRIQEYVCMRCAVRTLQRQASLFL